MRRSSLRTRPGRLVVLVAVSVLIQVATAAAAAPPWLTGLSGPTPFGDCFTQPGTPENFESEPYVARNPAHPSNLIAVWQQDRGYGGRGSMVASSHDGGRHWHTSVVPQADTCHDGAELVADHWVTFDKAGTAYIGALLGYNVTGTIETRFIVNRSTDGGRTWSDPDTILPRNPNALYDKDTITADPRRTGVLYAAWAQSSGAFGQQRQDVYVTRSEDGGRTWSTPTLALEGAGTRAFAGRILVRPDHSLTLIGERRPLGGLCTTNPAPKLLAVRSRDEGRTWSAPTEIADFRASCPAAPDHDKRIHGGFGEMATMDDEGDAYVVFSADDATTTTTPTTLTLGRSRDGGATWRFRTVAHLPGPAQLPQIAVDDHGALGVAWYDFRHDRTGDEQITTDYVLATATDDAAGFAQTRIARFDSLPVPGFRPNFPLPIAFYGDYVGMAGLGHGFGMAFNAGPPLARSGPTDIYYAYRRARPRTGAAPARLRRHRSARRGVRWTRHPARARPTGPPAPPTPGEPDGGDDD